MPVPRIRRLLQRCGRISFAPPALRARSATRPTPEDVREAYRLLLGRDPDPSGFQHWTARLGEMSLEDLVFEFLQSSEFQSRRLARLGAPRSFPAPSSPPPRMSPLCCQLVTQGQIDSTVYWQWCEALGQPPLYHRKQWEHVYLLQALEECGALRAGARGLGFGVGREPVVSVLAKRGCDLLVTDLDDASAARLGWRQSGEHSSSLDELHHPELCPRDVFDRHVRHRVQDMNAIGPELREGRFDFVWSLCAFEHLGSLERGLHFVRGSLACLRPGAVAVHTTEYNASSNDETVATGPTVLYRRRDIENFAEELRRDGYDLHLNLHPGDGPLDRYCDVPPYRSGVHLKLALDQFVATSLGLVIRKPMNAD